MDETIEVLGVKAKRIGADYRARTPLGMVTLSHLPGAPFAWFAAWSAAPKVCVTVADYERTAYAAAREATRRLRAIQRTCARAAAREEA